MTNVVFWNSFAFRGNWSLNSWTDLFQSQETQYRVQECRSRGGLQWSVKGGTQDTASPEPKRGHRPGTGQPLSSPPAVSLSSHVTLCPQSQPKKNRNKIYKKCRELGAALWEMWEKSGPSWTQEEESSSLVSGGRGECQITSLSMIIITTNCCSWTMDK